MLKRYFSKMNRLKFLHIRAIKKNFSKNNFSSLKVKNLENNIKKLKAIDNEKAIFWLNLQLIAPHVEKSLTNLVVRPGDFGPFSMNKEIAEFMEKHSISIGQVNSLRSWNLRDKAFRNQPKLNSIPGKDLLLSYENGTTVVDLSKKLDIPPINLFRIIIKHKYSYQKKTLMKVIKSPSNYLYGRDLLEFLEATKRDCIANPESNAEILAASLDFEKEIEDFLKRQQIQFKNQKELISEQKQLGNISVTPDWLILDKLYINNQRIHWIDAKVKELYFNSISNYFFRYRMIMDLVMLVYS